MEELMPDASIRWDFLLHSLAITAILGVRLDSCWWSRSPDGWVQVGLIPFKCAFFLLPAGTLSPEGSNARARGDHVGSQLMRRCRLRWADHRQRTQLQPTCCLCTCQQWKSLLHVLCYAKSLQSCPTLCDPIDSSPPGSPIPGVLQARTLEWVAISFFNAWKWKVKVNLLSRVWPSATPWTAAFQPPPSMGFSRQEYWSGVPLPSLIYAMGIGKCYKPSFTLKISC